LAAPSTAFATVSGPPVMSSSTVSEQMKAAIRDSANGTPSGVVVFSSASTAAGPSGLPPLICSIERGPG